MTFTRVTSCMFCNITTAGEHEAHCPLNPTALKDTAFKDIVERADLNSRPIEDTLQEVLQELQLIRKKLEEKS